MRSGLTLVLIVGLVPFVLGVGGGGGGGGSSGPSAEELALQNAIASREAGFGCQNQSSMAERILCRLGFPVTGQLDYQPEECRAKVLQGKLDCYDFYESVQPCWLNETDGERLACARTAIGFSASIPTERARCETLNTANKVLCKQKLRANVDKLVKFRLYQLSQKALYFHQEGAPQNQIVAFIQYIEETKQSYSAAGTKQAKIDLIRQVQTKWREFVEQIKDSLPEETE
ncbi:MAG: hypothetical protein FJY86_04145 [Candidatus Diapherotrites archaeon]|uniref:Uncharacterized protein n=1 Tax=Candidatus Iainarchaeum sp. TaxID=3101447 RepID=A0A8T4C939_9ARCH|nr:hypothetical protein [Candidatus Diapherotrites archaeon]